MVAVISNGTAVLGLGNIGAVAGKPVMEGKAVLFKISQSEQDFKFLFLIWYFRLTPFSLNKRFA